MSAGAYTSSSIVTNEGLEAIRHRPTQYIPTRDYEGQVHTAKEPIDNSNDELEQLKGGILTIVMFRDHVKNRYQLMIADTGRGIPLENDAFLRSLTVLNTSGKFSTDGAYRGSAGLFGVGGKVPAALSTRFKALSKRSNGTGMLYLNDSKIVEHVTDMKIRNLRTGVIICYELDPQFFKDLVYFMETGYLDIIQLFQLWGVFNNFHYLFKICDFPIEESFWTGDIETSEAVAIPYLYGCPMGCNVVYDSNLVDSESYLYTYFDITPPVVWRAEFRKDSDLSTDNIAYIIKMFMMKKLGNGKVGLINNIVPKNQDISTHVSIFYKAINTYVSQFIENKDLQKFFLEMNYKIPVYVALSVKCNGAEFSGTTKDAFIDADFGKAYEADLYKSFSTIRNEQWLELVSLFMDDLQDRYDRYHNRGTTTKQTSLLTLKLNAPTKFSPCRKTGPGSGAELFIVEGESASGIIEGRNSDIQAVWQMRGKIKNMMENISNINVARKEIKNNPFYQDFIKIVNLDQYNDPDLKNLNYGKIIFTMDADPDGAHIVALNISNLYILEPKLIENGHIWVATPPLYKMRIGKNGPKKYLRDKVALLDTKIEFIYKTILDIKIKRADGKLITLDDAAYRDFCYLVNEFGEKLEYSAKLLGTTPMILERLLYGYEYLFPHIDIEGLNTHFGVDDVNWFTRLHYDPANQMIIVSVEDVDHPISLKDLTKEIHQELFYYVKQYRFGKLEPIVTSKLDAVNGLNNEPSTPIQIYHYFKTMDNMVQIDRIKGLGLLNKEDVDITITGKNTRSLYHVTSVGDIEHIGHLMGDSSDERKRILFNTNMEMKLHAYGTSPIA